MKVQIKLLISKTGIEKTFLHNLESRIQISKGQNILISVSGGPDSVCLLELFDRLKEILSLKLAVFHLNHKLRGRDSEEDAKFVEKLCQNKGIRFFGKEVQVDEYCRNNNLSIQEGARKIRYKLLRETGTEFKADSIALGHNLNDLAETILLNIIRGSGRSGLVSIQLKRGIFIRPLLNIKRSEIEDFLKSNNIQYRTDATNVSEKYRRNLLRLEIIPKLIELNPKFLDNCWTMNQILSDEDSYLDNLAEKTVSQILSIDEDFILLPIEKLRKLEKPIFFRVIRRAIERVRGDIQSIEFKHLDMIDELVRADKNSLRQLPHGLIVLQEYGDLVIGSEEFYKFKILPAAIKCPGDTYLDELGAVFKCSKAKKGEVDFTNPKTAFLDWNKIKFPLIVRNRIPGDRFEPFGMKGTKKIQDFLVDLKVPGRKRDRIPIVSDKDRIVWVVGLRINERVKINSRTKDILKIIYKKPI